MARVTVWLRRAAVALLALALAAQAAADGAARGSWQMSKEPGVYLTPYRTAAAPPDEVGEFTHFTLAELPGQEVGEFKPDADGNVSVGGTLRTADGTVYRFKTAKLIKGRKGYERLTFTTEERGGVSYAFEGEFTDDPAQEQGQYITLRGMLTRYRGGRKAASARLGLYQWVEA